MDIFVRKRENTKQSLCFFLLPVTCGKCLALSLLTLHTFSGNTINLPVAGHFLQKV